MTNFNLTHSSWDRAIQPLLPEGYQEDVERFLAKVYGETSPTYPARDRVFYAYQKTALSQTKVIILGQDPYHQPGQAQGLAFSVPDGMQTPPSLRNILQELADDLGQARSHQDLTPWTEEGVMLLNAVLTVKEGQANAHQGIIWERLTDATIEAASNDDSPKVFILWGGFARKKARLIDQSKHLIIQSAHPSPLSAYRGFFGSKPFSRSNDFLKKSYLSPINWLK
ncbi:Uracil-DNA glycosylase (Ung) [Fructobacillus fructosus]|uniref:uracil-DNA glycosylase n=1 Tax=Fructobacillus fructosus TaxID=1631 RepID=UPI00021959FA|nr:uracil-DNA glycosylase [Fructobacillus fructosus]KRN53323.1 uracil-DNA glycosylase [Fructobacillus fructosus KCTC 3544]CAK1225536.1 Uracil-DNA glycosylase (Ung) [Fructobacillus fructosus]CAK1225865.1 Uracil-DNA glycosylase (Ung) [Fructobacillus fructosus]CAK1231198.1 Uracil-DNA glycosylase (Ung) [Fructobacillus fructosus]CAK1233482.1 Uracil-DNA glycosylase (Ung) [Fructobacillus fructosus]